MYDLEKTIINVELEGLCNIMFDRFWDHSKEDKPPDQKIYIDEDNCMVLPIENMKQFLCRTTRPVGVIKVVEERGADAYLRMIPPYTVFEPIGRDDELISFVDEKRKPIEFTGFKGGKKAKFHIFERSTVTRSSNGSSIKQVAKPRPQMKPPWFLQFRITLLQNDLIDENKLYNYYTRGGLEVALCNGRPWFGRFMVREWEVTNGA